MHVDDDAVMDPLWLMAGLALGIVAGWFIGNFVLGLVFGIPCGIMAGVLGRNRRLRRSAAQPAVVDGHAADRRGVDRRRAR
ncbi:hypothetical protein [Luteimonas abyssi]|jgi:hypothetical protein|uniref:hypothetical protein n=1 Tax=Luteimonas abyssi TaxID=1247514 RepID=UPI000B339AB7|nr:hypothetical protein [Luteimonas abyssi]